MITIRRTDSNDPEFRQLVQLLDQELEGRYGPAQAFYNQFNKPDTIPYALVAYWNKIPAAIGAIRPYNGEWIEIKRMFVHPSYRGRGLAKAILQELEKWGGGLGYNTFVLESGNRQPEALKLYEQSGYRRIPNYPPYTEDLASICMEKKSGK